MLPPSLSKPDLHLLHVFCTVADAQGFAAAQVTLNVSASTISRQITDLETRIGLRLCQRGRKGFRLTDQGKVVYHAAKSLFASVSAFSDTVNGTRGRLVGKLSLALVDNWVFNANAPIHQALQAFTKQAPDVELELQSLAPDDIERAIQMGQADLGIGVFHRPKQGIVYRSLSTEIIGLYCAQSHPLFDADCNADIPLLLASSNYARRTYLNEHQIAPISDGLRSSASAHQMEGIALLILTGKYIGYLPKAFASIWVDQGKMKSVDNGQYDLDSNIQVVHQRGGDLELVAQTFMDLLVAPRS